MYNDDSKSKKYEGEFISNKYWGYGTHTLKNGSYCEGYWKNGKQHGKGTCYKEDGTIKK